MKRLVLAVTVFFLVAGFAMAGNYEVTRKAGGFNGVVKIDKNPPVMGDNNLSLAVKDAKGAAVSDAKVTVDYSMPAMPGMPAMNYKASTELKGIEYKTKVNFSMSGSWNMVVRINRGGKTVQTKFNVDVR